MPSKPALSSIPRSVVLSRTLAVLACWGLASVGVLTVGASPAQAAGSYAVTSTDDSGPGTLRQAMLDAALAGGSATVTVDPTVAAGAVTLASPLPLVPAGTVLTIEAAGLTVDGGGATGDGVRAFTVQIDASLTLSHITVAHARATTLSQGDDRIGTTVFGDGADGAAVATDGTLVVRASRFVDNRSIRAGGAISAGYIPPPGSSSSSATLTVSDSVFEGNSAAVGGAISTYVAPAIVTGSTFTRNSGTTGSGALDAVGSATRVSSSTFAGNIRSTASTFRRGSAVGGRAPMTLSHVTLAGNGPSPAVENSFESTAIDNSIMDTSGCDLSEAGPAGGAYSIDPGLSCAFTAPTALSNTDPGLDPAGLRDNGGPTPTIALTPTSAAIDHGTAAGTTVDQRGLPRPVDNVSVPNTADGSDIGAVEDQRAGYAISAFLPPVPQTTPKAGSTIPVKVRVLGAGGAPISDAQAQALAAACGVQVTLSGVTLPSSCAAYNAATDTFQLDVKLPKSLPSGTYALTVQVVTDGTVQATTSTSVTIRH